MSTSRKPDYTLRFLNKHTEERGTLGAAWANEDGSISIVLNSRVVLRQCEDEVIKLFRRDRREVLDESDAGGAA